MRAGISFVLFVVLGGILMLPAHAFAAMLHDLNGIHVPYWWSYLILFPLAGIQAVRGGSLRPLAASLAVCLLPALYFIMIGVQDSNWHSSDTALLGVGIAFLITTVCTFFVGLRHGQKPA